MAQPLKYPIPRPKHYICFQANEKIIIDGILSETEWAEAKWTDYFLDITGSEGEIPFHNTRVKMLWDSNFFYFAAELKEDHIWAKLTRRDAVIYYDNDFEIFIDPDGDNHHYFELEINALNTIWDLFLTRPYRDTVKADNQFDIPQLRTAIAIDGTLNNPSDIDEKWTIEIAIPWKDIKEIIPRNRPPLNQEKWRINFSRVQWDTEVVKGKYQKRTDKKGKLLPEHNWVWSPQWAVNMHQPEFWGQVQFSTFYAGEKEVDFIEDVDFDLKMTLMEIYQKQKKYRRINGTFTKDLPQLTIHPYNIKKFGDLIHINLFKNGFTAKANGLKAIWKVNEKGHLTSRDYLH